MAIIARALAAFGIGVRPQVKVGDRAPDFTITDSTGSPVSLQAKLREGPVVLAFYPQAFTGGCTRELTTFAKQHGDLAERGANLLAISVDDVATLARFKASLAAPYTFLSDPGGTVAALYGGVTDGVANRVTFTIGQDGIITRMTVGGAALFPTGDIAACPRAQPPSVSA